MRWCIVWLCINSVNLYPETGFHVKWGEPQTTVAPNSWLLLKGWSEIDSSKGVFIEDIKVINNASTFIPLRTGLYYASLHIYFEERLQDIDYTTNISVNSNGKLNHLLSEGQSSKFIEDCGVLQINDNAEISVYVHVSREVKFTAQTSFSLQFISSFAHSLGFISSPKRSLIYSTKQMQNIFDWNVRLGIAQGFSKSTGSFHIPVNGLYLIVVKLVLHEIKNKIQVFTKDKSLQCVQELSFLNWVNSITLTYTDVRQFNAKTKVQLLMQSTQNFTISENSEYSIVLLKNTKDRKEFSYNLHQNQLIVGGDIKINDWVSSGSLKELPISQYYDGAFQFATTGYYYVSLKLEILPEARTYLKISFGIDSSGWTAKYVESVMNKTVVSTQNVLLVRQKESLTCYIKSNANILLLNSSTLTLFPVPLESYSSVHHNRQSDNETFLQGTFLHLREPSELHTNVDLSEDFKALKILENGVYLVTIIYRAPDFRFDLVNISLFVVHHKQSNLFASSIVNKDSSGVFSVVLFLNNGDSLKVWQDCPQECAELVQFSIEVQHLKTLHAGIGFSTKLSKISLRAPSSSNDANQFHVTYDGDVNFCSRVNITNDTLFIKYSGIYLLAVNLYLESSMVKNSVDIALILYVNSTQFNKPRAFISNANLKRTHAGSISFSNTMILNENDVIHTRVFYEKETNEIVEVSGVFSIVLLTLDLGKGFHVEGIKHADPTDGNMFAVQPSNTKNKYLDFIYDFIAKRTFAAILSVTLKGQVFFTVKGNHFIKVILTLRGKSFLPHLFATKVNISQIQSVFLHFQGTIVLKPNDLLQISVESSDGLRFRTEVGTSVSFAVLDVKEEGITTNDFFQSHPIEMKDLESGDNDIPITRGGVYLVKFTLSKSFHSSRVRRESRLKDFKTKMGSVLDNNSFIGFMLRDHQSYTTLLNFSCHVFPQSVFLMLSLKENQLLSARTNVVDAQVKSQLEYLKGESDDLFTQSLDYEMMCYDGARTLHHLSSFTYQPQQQSVVLFLVANMFANHAYNISSTQLFLVIAGEFDQKIVFKKNVLSSGTTLFQFAERLYIKAGETLQLYAGCAGNEGLEVQPKSRIYLFYQDSLALLGDVMGIPSFTIHPSPKLIQEMAPLQLMCEVNKNAVYTWSRVNYFTGEHSSNISMGSVLQLHGAFEESGQYFCSVYYEGYVMESNLATLIIRDINECIDMTKVRSSIRRCHENYSNCTNTPGSYQCTCLDGFQGDGFDCQDINECAHADVCGKNVTCANLIGSYNCSCEAGYRMERTEKKCMDINECEEYGKEVCNKHLSTTHAYCVNQPGTYSCNCAEGFKKEDNTCVDVNECMENPDVYSCMDHATCHNIPGSFYCKCEEGWKQLNNTCQDINECLNATLCADNAVCNNNPGSYRCVCKRGFKGDGDKQCTSLGCFPPSYCSGQYSASWWSHIPYISLENDRAKGLFKDILQMIVRDICNNCSEVTFHEPLKGFMQLERKVESNNTDFAFPLYGLMDTKTFSGFPFIPIVEAPGIAFFAKNQKHEQSPLIQSLVVSWPILVITLLLASLSGVIVWFLDTVQNPDEFPHHFFEGSWDGFWWAFVTMTTVGYGDKSPRSFFARVFGIIWIFVGLVIISTFTATITTTLTARSLDNTVKLNGLKVGALPNSEEYRIGVRKNADVAGYRSVSAIIKALEADEIQGALLDTFIAGEFQKELQAYKLVRIIEFNFVYGVALVRDAQKLEARMRRYMELSKNKVYDAISQVVKPLKENKAAIESEASAAVFDSHSPIFFKLLLFGVTILAVLMFVGFLWDYLYWRRGKRPKKRNRRRTISRKSQRSRYYSWRSMAKENSFVFKNEVKELKNEINLVTRSWIEALEVLEKSHEEQMLQLRAKEGAHHIPDFLDYPSFRHSQITNSNDRFLKLFECKRESDL